MAKQRRPSIPLIIVFIILLFLFFFAGTLVELMSSLTAQGSFTYSYMAGSEPIVSIDYTLPQDLADVMVSEQASGWTVNLAGNVLSLTGGTLNPGDSVTVDYRLSNYIKGGARTITATGTTTSGAQLASQSSFQVPEAFLLALAWMMYQNAIWLLILAIIVLVLIIVLFIRGKKKDKEQEQKEPTNPTGTKDQD
ncbi:MAG: hypothetical protein CW691_09875 [Candidatus Bathyarchaeum sp.]|nr:MAG: hypothetical protein CW691_09875 [Candidatus Bathyarchaeum sp.]